MTCSVGFRAPSDDELASELLQRLADAAEDGAEPRLYRDPGQAAVERAAELPRALLDFARRALQRRLAQPEALARALGEALTEPKPRVWFESSAAFGPGAGVPAGVRLDARTRMMYDRRHLYINGEAFRIGGGDARLLRGLADQRRLDARGCAALSADAARVLGDWLASGWLLPSDPPETPP